MPSPAGTFSENISVYSNLLGANRRTGNLVAILRMIAFLVLVAGLYFFTRNSGIAWLSFFLAGMVLFLVLVRYSFRLKDRRLMLEKLILINTNEQGALNYLPGIFDDGKSFQSGHSYLADLDIFGAGSLYHLLNRATTSHGREWLANALKVSYYEKKDIESIQDSVRTMSGQVRQRQLITASGLVHQETEGNLRDVYSWLEMPSVLSSKKWIMVCRWLLPLLALGAAYYYLDSDHLFPLALCIGVNWLLTGYFLSYINRQHSLLSKKQQILDQYTAILRSFLQVDAGRSPLLIRLQAGSGEACRSISRLAKLTQFFDQRLNMLVSLIMNSFLLYDVQCTLELERWKGKNKSALPGWIHSVGNIECLNSLASFAYNHPDYVYPVVTDEFVQISARKLAHPLIPDPDRVANDVILGKEGRIHLITGSNMSGKTTFLRTVGVNMVLAQCGAPVCATEFIFRPMRILSSVRITDSLQEHTSYFMAELKRLLEIVSCLEEGFPALVLIDEILRGTNSEDKTLGSEKFIARLLEYPCLSLFATHDLTLGQLEEKYPDRVRNYCFESQIRDGELFFDYLLKKGIAKNRNASFLMEKMGITRK
jgi:hypothetical protein